MKFPTDITVWGDTDYRGDCPSEAAEQIAFFNKLRTAYPTTLGLVALHPRNEGKRSHYQAQRQKAEGLTVGAADVIIPGRPALVLELKRLDHTNSRWQEGQIEYLRAAQALGAVACVALGWQAGMDAVASWCARD